MPLQVKPDYVNPLTMIKENKNNPLKKQAGNIQDSKSDKLTKLRTKQQALQNEMLLMKSTGTDSAGDSTEKLKALQKKLEEVSTDLRTAQSNSSGSTEKAMLSQLSQTEQASLQSEKTTSASILKPDVDTYEKAEKESKHPGIYRREADRENNHKVSFIPYTET